MPKLTGTHGYLKKGSTPLCVKSWEIDFSPVIQETPDTCVPGYNQRTLDMLDYTGTFESEATEEPLDITEGDDIALELGNKPAADEIPMFSTPKAIVTSVKVVNPIPGMVVYTVGYACNGPYSRNAALAGGGGGS